MFDLNNIIRDNIRSLTPYSSARDEFKGSEGIFLDANENPFNEPYNRYPDPLQWKVKEKLADIKGVTPEQVFLGNGSDEAIDLLIRAFCEPHRDNIVSINPSYGMYQVAADINAVEFVKVPLNEDFTFNVANIRKAVNFNTRLIMLCSPNNPTANSLEASEMLSLADGFTGLVVVDEAYIDFSTQPSLIKQLAKYKNLVILQTFSKAWGLAGLRLGIAYASEEIISILNKIKYPYNVNVMTQKLALEALDEFKAKENWVNEILLQRKYLIEMFSGLKLTIKIYPSDANFILVKVPDARKIYDYLIDKKIIIRDRSKVAMCEGCLRITVGNKYENKALYDALVEFESLKN
jgi:histidinol-phosphate aminotransferase